MTCWLSFLVSQSTERTRLLGRGIDQNAQTHESFELAYERNAEPSTNPEPNPTDRSIEEIGIDAALEPALGRKTWKGLLILILTPLLLSPLPIVIPNVVGDFRNASLPVCFSGLNFCCVRLKIWKALMCFNMH